MSQERREWMELVASLRAEVERLRAALLKCSTLASGEHHMSPSDRCAAICVYVQEQLAAARAE